jgi:hypothetical protein
MRRLHGFRGCHLVIGRFGDLAIWRLKYDAFFSTTLIAFYFLMNIEEIANTTMEMNIAVFAKVLILR